MKLFKSNLLWIFLLIFPLIFQGCQKPVENNNSSSELQSSSENSNNETIENDLENIAQEITQSYLEKNAIESFDYDLTLAEAQEIQEKFIKNLIPTMGNIVGYKAGLTNSIAQEKFGFYHPLRGFLLEKMLIQSGESVPLKFGSIPMVEGDLIVRVGSENINNAITREEALNSLDAVIPFIELPDLIYSPNIQLNGEKLQAINVGARLGVIGKPIPLNNNENWQDSFKEIQLTLLDSQGNELGKGSSKALLDHPLDVVLWLKDSLKAKGNTLKKGDLLSLGTITPLIPVKSEMTVKAIYTGLIENETVEIEVKFINR